MTGRILIRNDVLVSVRCVLYWIGAGTYTLAEFYDLWQRLEYLWRGNAPKACDATPEEIADACYALGVLRSGNRIFKSW